jgi:hypothetical protein
MIDKRQAVDGTRFGRGNRCDRRKPASPQIPRNLTWDRNQEKLEISLLNYGTAFTRMISFQKDEKMEGENFLNEWYLLSPSRWHSSHQPLMMEVGTVPEASHIATADLRWRHRCVHSCTSVCQACHPLRNSNPRFHRERGLKSKATRIANWNPVELQSLSIYKLRLL